MRHISRPTELMARPKRVDQATAMETSTPPTELESNQAIARIVKGEGKNIYVVSLPNEKTLLVELAPRFRNTIWMMRGGFVLVDTSTSHDRDNKLDGEIVNIVRDVKKWRKQAYWPVEFPERHIEAESDDEESTVGKMPPEVDDSENL